MARALRIQYPGAIHHVTSRGNERKRIFRSDTDRRQFVELLGKAARRYGWLVSAWALMPKHFHIVIETPQRLTLSDGMQWLNGKYAEWFNERYKRVGHLFQGRFKSFLVEKETYLQEVVRYVALNPVRAKIVDRPENYRWSSYRATAGLDAAPSWLAIESLIPYFGEADAWRANYRAYVQEKVGSEERLWDKAVNQIYLGSPAWLKKIRMKVESKPRSNDYPAAQRAVGRPAMATIVKAVAKAFSLKEGE